MKSAPLNFLLRCMLMLGFGGLCLATDLVTGAAPWHSALYPENWVPPGDSIPFASAMMIQDFSYAGYGRGEAAIPHVDGPVFDVTDYGADATGASDSTLAIQNAIDAAAAAGGGVVFLPAGEFRVAPQGSNTFALRISTSHIVLRGAGMAATFLLNTSHTMREKAVIQVSPPSVSSGPLRAILTDLPGPTRRIPVQDAGSFAPGNIVRIQWSFTDDWIIENNQQTWWNQTLGRPANATYLREVTATNAAEGWIEIDVPTRYAIRTRDAAQVRTLGGLLSHVGIESLAIGNLQHPGNQWGENDHLVVGASAHDVHASWLIRFQNVRDSWLRDVHSRAAAANDRTCHMLSNGISLTGCLRVTVRNCEMRRPQYGGGGGNGYMYRIQNSNECLVADSIADFCRHGFVVSHAGASGNVFHQCQDRETQRAVGSSPSGYTTSGSGSDNHMHFSHSNLWDRCHAHNSFYTAHHRTFFGTTPHGITSAHGVYWNTTGSGTRYNDIVRSDQLHHGYVIGTGGTRSGATSPTTLATIDGVAVATTAPSDHLEGIGHGARMAVPSLYLDQLAKRMQGVLVNAGRDDFTAPTSAYPLAGTTYGYGSTPLATRWTQISGPAAAVFADATSPATTVALPQPGTYVLEMSATQGTRSASAQVVLRVGTVAPASLSHFIRGEAQNTLSTVGYFTNNSAVVGTSGTSGSREDRNPVLGYTLPTLPAGTTLDAATLTFEITQALDSTGAANLPDLHVYLLDTPDPSDSGTGFFFHGSSDVSTNVRRIGSTSVPLSGNFAHDFAAGEQVRGFTLGTSALELLRSYYDGHVPTRSTVYFRFNLGVDPALADLRRYQINISPGGSRLGLVPTSPGTAFTITYHGNGATEGEAPMDSIVYYGVTPATVLSPGNLAREGFQFTGWNTMADGSGTSHPPGSVFDITADTILHAQWTPRLNPVIDSWPTASPITEGEPLHAATLGGGLASVPGNFDFRSPHTIPPAGDYLAAVRFTPIDTASYNPMEGTVRVSVRTAFESWADGEITVFPGDANLDGVADGLAWLLGAVSPAADARALLPVAVRNQEALELTFHVRDQASRGSSMLHLQYGDNLRTWTTVPIPEKSGMRDGVEFVVTPDGSLNHVVAIIVSAAPLGAIFVRLSATESPNHSE